MKNIGLSLSFIVSAIITCLLIYYKLYTYAIVAVTLTGLILMCVVYSFFEAKTPESAYNKTIRNLIKTYDSILVDIEKIPDLDVKNIINVSSFEKLVDVQYELKKPIFYKMSLNSCSFILLDIDIAYIYVLRVNEESFSPLDDIIKSVELDAKKRKEDKKILEGIDKTTIIRLDDLKEYKISPIREKDVKNIKETNYIDQSIENPNNKNKKKDKTNYYYSNQSSKKFKSNKKQKRNNK